MDKVKFIITVPITRIGHLLGVSTGRNYLDIRFEFIITVPMTRVGHLLGVSTGRNYLDVRFVIHT
jgi:hypothetical protein